MKKLIVNEDWETVEVNDTSSFFVLIFKQGSNTAGYIKCYNTDDAVVFAEYKQLIEQYANTKFEEPTSILVIKVPATGQVKTMLEEAVYAGDETNPTKIEIINHLLERADCEYIEEKVLMSLEEAKKKKKKKRTPKVTYLTGFPFLNDHRFNHACGTCDCGKDAAEDANSEMGSDSTGEGSGDGSFGGDAAGEGGAMGESLTEAMTPLQKMQALEAGTRGFNAAAASDIKLMDNLITCAKNNLQKAAVVMLIEIQKRMNNGSWTLGPVPGLNMPGTPASTTAPQKTSQNSNISNTTNTTSGSTGPSGASGVEVLTFEPSDFDPSDFALIENNQNNPRFLIEAVENFSKPLHWGLVLLVLSASGGFTRMTQELKEWLLKRITKTTLKQIISHIKQTPEIIDRVTAICNKEVTEGVTKMTNLTEAKRYVKRYYIRPQNVFASNKAEILQRLAEVEADGANCSVYSLKALEDHDDVHLLQPKDIIYYYDEGVLYDKNHVPVLDYDLNVKNEEERPKISADATSDARFKDVYQDRMTDRTFVETLEEDFYLDFDDVNVYGVKLTEGKEAEYTCCICGDDFEGYGNNPAPYKESGKCCDACNRKFVIPARLAQVADDEE
jgi:DNA-binding protein YbaB